MPGIDPEMVPYVALVIMALLASVVGVWVTIALRLAFRLPVLPGYKPRVVPWGAGSVLIAILIWYGTTHLVVIGYSVANPGKVAQARANGGMLAPVDAMALTTIYNSATMVLVPLALAASAGARRRDFGLVGPGLARQASWGVMAYPVLAPFVMGIMLLAATIWRPETHPLQDAIKGHLSPGLAALMILASAVLAPAAEELIFRGVLLGWLTRVALLAGSEPRRASEPDLGEVLPPPPDLVIEQADLEVLDAPTGEDGTNLYQAPASAVPGVQAGGSGRGVRLLMANVIVSIVFATLHGQVWPTPIPLFFLSIGLGVLYQRTGGLAAPIALHMTFNGVSTLLMFLAVGFKAPNPPVPEPAQVAATHHRAAALEIPRLRLVDVSIAD